MTCGEWLRKYTLVFQQAGIDEAVDEASALLCHALELGKAEIFAQPERTLNVKELALLDGLTMRRLRREPSAYITGRKEFYGLSLFVDSRVLIPRPETEVVVEAAVAFGRPWVTRNRRQMLAVDVGTGCGAIAIALAVHMKEAQIFAVDISPAALEVAVINVRRRGLDDRIIPVQGNLLEKINQKMDLIVANLPYIRSGELSGLQPEISMYEPASALDGGDSGTDVIEAMLAQAVEKTAPGGAILLEIGMGQDERLIPVVHDVLPGWEVALIKDFSNVNRCMKITKVD